MGPVAVKEPPVEHMSLTGKRWEWPAPAPEAAGLAAKLDLPVAAAGILLQRGINNAGAAGVFLSPSPGQLHSPWLMAGIEGSARRILQALKKEEKICVYGDYDADGITATVILVEALRELGAEADYFLPSRFTEGYGLHKEALASIREKGASLVITVDCGINAVDEVKFAVHCGLDIIVTDHHQPLVSLDGAVAVVNPLQESCPYPYKALSGAGIAFKLASALMEKAGRELPERLLDLAALGTVADVVPLLEENRVIAACGLEQMKTMARPGLKALVEASDLEPGKLGGGAVAFILAPSINAAGRMGDAGPAARLLLESNEAVCRELALELRRENRRRREREQEILKEAEEMVLADRGAVGEKIITLAAEGWHHGVIGIVASRLADRFYRPVVLIALEDGEGRGSARSIPGFDITRALSACAPLLERFGGHAQAAGLMVEPARVEALRDELNRVASSRLKEEDLVPGLSLEAELDEEEFNLDLARSLASLQPFGAGNPNPLFGSRGWELQDWRLVGADRSHLKLYLRKAGKTIAPMFFAASELESRLFPGRHMDLAFTLKEGLYRDEPVLDINIKDLRYADSAVCQNIEVIDRRGAPGNRLYLQKLLQRRENPVAVFAATGGRRAALGKDLAGAEKIYFPEGKALSVQEEPLPGTADLVLFDLPLTQDFLYSFIDAIRNDEEPLRIHLLYGRKAQELNEVLLEKALPTATALEEIYLALAEAAGAGEQPDFPGSWAEGLSFSPAGSFWRRCRNIFIETGLLEVNGESVKVNRPAEPPLKNLWQKSDAFKDTLELSEKCRIFQKMLLEASREELARRWGGVERD